MTLTVSLLRAAGIPALNMHGNWIDTSISRLVYMWTAAYIDGRWITIDTNWDNNSTYTNGIFSRLPHRNTYFDISIEDISSERILHQRFISTPVLDSTLTVSRTFVQLNGDCLGVEPRIINGRTMVPMRAIFEALGAEVIWNSSEQAVHATWQTGTNIILLVNNPLWDARVNGQWLNLDQPAVIINGSTFVPLRFVGEALGVQVNWVG
jgi:hypothetical protein